MKYTVKITVQTETMRDMRDLTGGWLCDGFEHSDVETIDRASEYYHLATMTGIIWEHDLYWLNDKFWLDQDPIIDDDTLKIETGVHWSYYKPVGVWVDIFPVIETGPGVQLSLLPDCKGIAQSEKRYFEACYSLAMSQLKTTVENGEFSDD